jgi:hypothetical protein
MNHPMLEMLGRFPWPAGTLVALVLVGWFGLWLAADRRGLALQRATACAGLQAELGPGGAGTERWSMAAISEAGRKAAQAEEQLERWRASLAGGLPDGSAVEEPRDRSEGFFALDDFRSRMRTRAVQLGVGLREDEQFGFATYVHEGPDDRLLAAVHRQRQLIEFLLEALFREPPVELRNVQRERPTTGRADEILSGSLPGGDYFALDPHISARVSGLIETIAVRLVFVGRTGTLRAFLAGIGGYGLPLIVRAVEAEDAGPLKTGVRPKDGEDWDGLSQFSLIVEHVRLVKNMP